MSEDRALVEVYWVKNLLGSLHGLYWIEATSYFVIGAIIGFAMPRGLGWSERSARHAIPNRHGMRDSRVNLLRNSVHVVKVHATSIA